MQITNLFHSYTESLGQQYNIFDYCINFNECFRYHWLYSATAYNHAYADTGLFCIHASCTPSYVKDMVEVIIHEMVTMTSGVSDNELAV